ncbi:MAG: hypothetical protein RSF90_05670, partial [Pygmaiobacter sp.]
GLWYMDITDNPESYSGKTVRFKAQVCQTPRVPKGCFAPGRFLMNCCAQDITFVGLVCKDERAASYVNRDWITVTAKVKLEYQAIYSGKGPVLQAQSIVPAEKAQNEVVTRVDLFGCVFAAACAAAAQPSSVQNARKSVRISREQDNGDRAVRRAGAVGRDSFFALCAARLGFASDLFSRVAFQSGTLDARCLCAADTTVLFGKSSHTAANAACKF